MDTTGLPLEELQDVMFLNRWNLPPREVDALPASTCVWALPIAQLIDDMRQERSK